MKPSRAASSGAPSIRVLCLHGRRQTGTLFSRRVSGLVKRGRDAGIEFLFPDAPFPAENGTLCWWDETAPATSLGVALSGLSEQLRVATQESRPIQALLGFSQGGAVAAALALTRQEKALCCAVLVAPPDCGDWVLEAPRPLKGTASSPPALFVIAGRGDRLVPIEDSLALAKRCVAADSGVNFEFSEHELGHLVPTKYFDPIIQFILSKCNNSNITSASASASTSTSINTTSVPPKHVEQPKYLIVSEDVATLQREEIDSIEAIFGADIIKVSEKPTRGNPAPLICVSLLSSSDEAIPKAWRSGKLKLRLQFTGDYPVGSSLKIDGLDSSQLSNVEFPDQIRDRVLAEAKDIANRNLGIASVYSIVVGVEDLLLKPITSNSAASSTERRQSFDSIHSNENGVQDADVDNGSSSIIIADENDEPMILEAMTEAAKSSGTAEVVLNGKKPGMFNIVVGLVGKPNAGKSTFFNCVTRAAMELDGRRQAQVGAYPFTTIEPNFGIGLFRPEWSTSASSADHQAGSDRLMPILIKDVAGLVPGAWKGLGKGNKFLNDLLDADILIHVCDASGKSNANGELVGSDMGGTTVKEDARWIRLEIHRWIASNVLSKWDSVTKWKLKSSSSRTSKQHEGDRIEKRVCSLFTGYHCRSRFVRVAAEHAGLDLTTADLWSRKQIHHLVAHFISLRFPMFLALNKIDAIDASTNGENKSLDEAMKVAKANGEIARPVCGGVESFLLQSSALMLIDYEIGSNKFSLLPEGQKKYESDKTFQSEVERARYVLDNYGGTGVLLAISEAIKLCHPVYVFPVPPSTGTAVTSSLASTVFRDCLIVTPGTTIEAVYESLHRGKGATQCSFRLEGDLVRIDAKSFTEALTGGGVWHQVSKDVIVDESTCVVRIFTNRKVAWQQQLGR